MRCAQGLSFIAFASFIVACGGRSLLDEAGEPAGEGLTVDAGVWLDGQAPDGGTFITGTGNTCTSATSCSTGLVCCATIGGGGGATGNDSTQAATVTVPATGTGTTATGTGAGGLAGLFGGGAGTAALGMSCTMIS